MKKINVILLLMALLPMNTCFGKNIFTYSLQLLSPPPTIDNGQYVYPTTVSDPNKDYIYSIDLKTPIGYNGQIPSMRFTFVLVNGKFSDGTTTMKMSYDSLQLYKLHVKWNDISTPTADTAKISITNAFVVSDTANSSLEKGSIQKIVRKIASLKGQVPTLIASPNRSINDNSQIIASVFDMVYPDIYEGVIQTNKKVRQFEWTLPTNWVTTTGSSGTFITDLDVKQITVIPDYVTVGSIKVRGVNDITSAYSEYATQNFDRGFSFITYPQSITFGDFTSRQFSVTSEPGITFEWSAPSGWKINGQGNSLIGVNLNSVSIIPAFCSFSDWSVKVRLIKGTDVSDWNVFPHQAMVQPTIITTTSLIHQFENADFSISDIVGAGVNNVTWTGTGAVTNYNQGINSKIAFSQSGSAVVTANIYMIGCSTPVPIYRTIYNIKPSRLSFISPQANTICNVEQFRIDSLPASGNSVVWNVVNPSIVSYPTTGNPINITKLTNGKISVQPIVNNCTPFSSKDINVGTPYSIGIISYSNLTMYDAGNFQVLPGSGYYAYEGILFLSDVAGIATNYSWSLVSSTSGKPVYWWPNGGSVDVAMKLSNTTLTLKCTASNSCGSYYQYYTFLNGDIGPLLLTPNPTSMQVEVSVPDDDVASNSAISTSTMTSVESSSVATYSVTVVDGYGLTVYSATKKDKKFNIPTSSFRNGIYAVIVSDGTNVYQNKLVVKH